MNDLLKKKTATTPETKNNLHSVLVKSRLIIFGVGIYVDSKSKSSNISFNHTLNSFKLYEMKYLNFTLHQN